MSVDKDYCMSSYLAFRYIEDDMKNFYIGMRHESIPPVSDSEKLFVRSANDINRMIENQFLKICHKKLGILLSGGMDSAILASYMRGCDAYTFRFLGGEFQKEELQRAKYYAECYDLNLHYIDITWATVEKNLDAVMEAKAAPVHSIEPQILQGAIEAQSDAIEMMIVGESSDLLFGGMDGLLACDWTFDAFMQRYIFTQPAEVLANPVGVEYLFERYRTKGHCIDFLLFMKDVFAIESSSSYWNAFSAANMPYYDPYARLEMVDTLDLFRVRHGEPKYLIRELFSMKYPGMPIPDKIPMPRPVDMYFAEWQGPKRPEFKKNLDITKFSGNQKWQIWCLEQFLNKYEPR
ncbi:MAG: asparagine synthase-related protein [Cloacibacillus sp.]